MRLWLVVAARAVLRGSYHLYQGFGAFVGNAVMGVVFALFFLRFKRVMPLIVAHSLLGHRGVRRLHPAAGRRWLDWL